MQIKELQKKAKKVRRLVFEKIIVSGKGHIGGTYSCVELLVGLYFSGLLKIDLQNLKWHERDRVLLGKGHACLGLYAIFLELGMMSQEIFNTYGENGGLGGQLDISTPGIEYNTGSLGHVLGIGAGIALAAKLDNKNYRSYAIMGDAECFEGSVWEAIAFAGQHKLDKLIGIIDRNRLSVTEVLDDESLFRDFETKLRAFDWDFYEIDGHSFSDIMQVLQLVQNAKKPTMILANTIKGKGISYMENQASWHHGVPNSKEIELARNELDRE